MAAFGPNNTVYANSLIFDDTTTGGNCSGIAVNVSYDGGLTWTPPAVFQNDCVGGLNDKNWIVVDNSNAPGHHQGRLYAVWDRVAPVVYNYCDTHCENVASWAFPNFLPISPLQGISSIPLVLQDGSLGVVYGSLSAVPAAVPGDQPDISPGSQQIEFALAPGAGSEPLGAPLTFTQTTIPVASDQSNGARYQRAAGLISADVDQKSGTIYVAWEDSRFRTESPTVVNDPAIIASTNNDGLTWGPVTRVDSGAPTNDYVNRYNTAVALGSDGVVHVMYRQRQEDADPKSNGSTFSPVIDTYYQESHDGGASFTAPLKVDTGQATNFYYGAFSRGGLFQGDYDQLATGGPYTYVVRDESYPIVSGEPFGLKFYPGDGPLTQGNTPPAHYEGDYSLCPGGNTASPTITPSCLPHLHQRTWVAVLGAATTTVAVASPSVAPAATLPNTAIRLPDFNLEPVFALAALILVSAIANAMLRRRATHR